LAVAYAVLTKHAGAITLESTVGAGTTATLYVPAAAQVASDSPLLPAGVPAPGNGRMLVVDDEESVRSVLQEMLTHVGYTVDVAAAGEEAIAQYARALAAGDRYAAVILDYMLPGGMGGRDILEQLRALDPRSRRCSPVAMPTIPSWLTFPGMGSAASFPNRTRWRRSSTSCTWSSAPRCGEVLSALRLAAAAVVWAEKAADAIERLEV
jgi:CheY-like chemotaxis protein